MNIFFGKPPLMPAKYTVLAGEGLGDRHFILMNKPLQQRKPQLNSLHISTMNKSFAMFDLVLRDYLYL